MFQQIIGDITLFQCYSFCSNKRICGTYVFKESTDSGNCQLAITEAKIISIAMFAVRIVYDPGSPPE